MNLDKTVKCDESVHDRTSRWPRYHTCGRPVFEDGKCKIHCPSSKKKREEKSRSLYEENTQRDRMMRANWMRQQLDKYPLDFLKSLRDEISVELEKRS